MLGETSHDLQEMISFEIVGKKVVAIFLASLEHEFSLSVPIVCAKIVLTLLLR